MLEEKILNFVTDALISSSNQLDTMSKTFYFGSRRYNVGTLIAEICKAVKKKLKFQEIDVKKHYLLFEHLSEICANIKTQSTIIYVLCISLKLITVYLVKNEELKTEDDETAQEPIIPKPDIMDLENLPDDDHKPEMQKVVINSGRWLNALKYLLEEVRNDPLVEACLKGDYKSIFRLNALDFSAVKAMVSALEAFTQTWKENEDLDPPEALSKAVAAVEAVTLDKKYNVHWKRKVKHRRSLLQINPGVQVVATSFRSMLEAIKAY